MAREMKHSGGIFDVGGVLAHDVWEGICFDPKRGLAVEHHLDSAQLARIGRELWQRFDTRPSRAECPRLEQVEAAYWQAFVEAEKSRERELRCPGLYEGPARGMTTTTRQLPTCRLN